MFLTTINNTLIENLVCSLSLWNKLEPKCLYIFEANTDINIKYVTMIYKQAISIRIPFTSYSGKIKSDKKMDKWIKIQFLLISLHLITTTCNDKLCDKRFFKNMCTCIKNLKPKFLIYEKYSVCMLWLQIVVRCFLFALIVFEMCLQLVWIPLVKKLN